MGGRGTFAVGKNVAYTYETVGKIEGVKVLEKTNKNASGGLPEEAHSSTAYIMLNKNGDFRMYTPVSKKLGGKNKGRSTLFQGKNERRHKIRGFEGMDERGKK